MTDSQRYPSVTSFSNGNFVVTWNSFGQDGSEDGVYSQLFDGDANRIGNEFQVNTYRPRNQLHPSVASFSNGNFVVAWDSCCQEGDEGVYGQLFDGNGVRIGSEFQVNTNITNDQDYPSAASFSNGNFVVTWTSGGSQDGSKEGVYGQLFNGNAVKIGNEFQVNTYTTDWQRYSSVATFGNDNFVVTWQSFAQDGSLYGIYGQLFDGNGIKLGNEFQVNTYTTDGQQDPSATSFSNGNFVVIWESYSQDGSEYGIYGQLFEGPLITSSTSEMPTSSSILSATSNQPTSRTDSTTISSSTTSHNMISSTITRPSTLLTTSSSASDSISSNEEITTSIPSTKNSEITSSEGSDSNVGLIVGIIAGVGGGCGLIVLLTYLYLNKKGAKNPEEVDLDTNSKKEKIIYANAPEKPEDDEYANYPKGVQEEIQYANAPKRAQEDEYANMPNKIE